MNEEEEEVKQMIANLDTEADRDWECGDENDPGECDDQPSAESDSGIVGVS